MAVWEMQFANANQYSMLIYSNIDAHSAGLFNLDGKEKYWEATPHVAPAPARGRVKQKPLADFPALLPGALVLRSRAFEAMQVFLKEFGQFLEMNCMGEIVYLYNVTTLLSCIDEDRSSKLGKSIRFPAFFEEAIPQQPLIFKDPRTVRTAIYLNDAAAIVIKNLLDKHQLTGLGIIQAGRAIPVS